MTHPDDDPRDVTPIQDQDSTEGAGAGRAINRTWEELRDGEDEDAALDDPTGMGDEDAAKSGLGIAGEEDEAAAVDDPVTDVDRPAGQGGGSFPI